MSHDPLEDGIVPLQQSQSSDPEHDNDYDDVPGTPSQRDSVYSGDPEIAVFDRRSPSPDSQNGVLPPSAPSPSPALLPAPPPSPPRPHHYHPNHPDYPESDSEATLPEQRNSTPEVPMVYPVDMPDQEDDEGEPEKEEDPVYPEHAQRVQDAPIRYPLPRTGSRGPPDDDLVPPKPPPPLSERRDPVVRNQTPNHHSPQPIVNNRHLSPPEQPQYPPRKTPERHPSFPKQPRSPDSRSQPRRNHVPDHHHPPPTTPDSGGIPLPGRSLSTLAGGEQDDRGSTKNTIRSYRTDRTDRETQLRNRTLYRSAVTHLLCGLYALVLIVLGLVFSISSSLRTKLSILEDELYLQIFVLYIFTVSFVFLCYLHCCLFRYGKPKSTESMRRVNLVSNNQMDAEKFSGEYHRETDVTSTLSKQRSRSRSRSHSDFEDVLDTLSHAVNAVTFDAQGINFYLRLGAVAFGTGSMIHDGFRLASLFIDGEFSLTCRGPIYVAVSGVHLLFTFFQTFYIFKSHKIVVNKHKAFVRFGFMHMVATNICVWCITSVTETAEHLRSEVLVTSENITTTSSPLNTTGGPDQIKCVSEYLKSLALTAAPYLYPCTIEYSLIAAAVLYKMYRNVGTSARQHASSGSAAFEDATQIRMDCHKANKGLFVGLLVGVLTLIAVSCYFVFDQTIYDYEAGSLIFFGTEIVLLSLSCAVVVVGFARMQRLRYAHDAETAVLDNVLLICGLFGIFFLNAFIIISSVSALLPFNLFALLSLVTASSAFFQSFLQTIFIMDALRRCARNETDVQQKPGRAIVTFLLLCNLSLWVVNTFELKKAESIPLHLEYFGTLPWSMISYICIPLIIFFRFHSTVCLSDIWVNAYKLKKKDN